MNPFFAINHAFLYMFDINSRYASRHVYGSPVTIHVMWHDYSCTLRTPKSRTRAALNAFYSDLDDMFAHVTTHNPPHIVLQVCVPDTTNFVAGGDVPISWNPFVNYTDAVTDWTERAAFVKRVLARNNIWCDVVVKAVTLK